MKGTIERLLILFLCLGYCACTFEAPKDLKLETVRVVNPKAASSDIARLPKNMQGPVLVIDLSSSKKLEFGTGVYTWFCNQLRPASELNSSVMSIPLENFEPSADGRYKYHVFDAVSRSPIPVVGWDGYDLTQDNRDVCLQTELRGYTWYVSNIIVIQNQTIRKALENEGVPIRPKD